MFEEFIGRVVRVVEFHIEHNGIMHSRFSEEENDPVIKELETKNSNVRVWLPDTVGTMDYNSSRINVYVDKNAEGSFVITKIDRG